MKYVHYHPIFGVTRLILQGSKWRVPTVADPDHLVTGGDSFPARFRGGVVNEVP